MKVYLAGISGVRKQLLEDRVDLSQLYVLESYFSMQKWFVPLIHRFGSFLLDSGAFTFMSDAKKHGEVDWENYADRYADFTRENQIKLYFELDIDVIVGLPEVERLRQRIEKRVGWKSIPVWHVSRGKDKFLEIATDYLYRFRGNHYRWGEYKDPRKIHAVVYQRSTQAPRQDTWVGVHKLKGIDQTPLR